MLDAERNARSATAGVLGALAWLVFAWVLAPITLAIFWLVGVLGSGVSAVTLGVVVGSAWLLLVLAPRALRRG